MNLEEISCPRCAQQPIVIENDEADIAACSHLAFVYHSQSPEFEYAAPSFLTELTQDAIESWNINNYMDILQSEKLATLLTVTECELPAEGHFRSKPWLVVGFYNQDKPFKIETNT